MKKKERLDLVRWAAAFQAYALAAEAAEASPLACHLFKCLHVHLHIFRYGLSLLQWLTCVHAWR